MVVGVSLTNNINHCENVCCADVAILIIFCQCFLSSSSRCLTWQNSTEKIGETSVTRDEAVVSVSDTVVPLSGSAAVDEEVVDIDLADPDVQKAAVFIQSSFKGFKQRKILHGLAKVDFDRSLFPSLNFFII